MREAEDKQQGVPHRGVFGAGAVYRVRKGEMGASVDLLGGAELVRPWEGGISAV